MLKTGQRAKVPEHLHGGQYSCQYVSHTVEPNYCVQGDGQRPWEAQQHILYNGTVVIGLQTHNQDQVKRYGHMARSNKGLFLSQQWPYVDRRSPLSERCSPRHYGQTDPNPSSDPKSGCSMNWLWGSWCIDIRKSGPPIHLRKTANRTVFNWLTWHHIHGFNMSLILTWPI